MKYDELKQKADALVKRHADENNELFDLIIKALFEENPKIKDVTFKGYIPSFNDGDPCSFSSTHDYPEVNTNGLDDEDEDDEDEDTDNLEDIASKYLSIIPTNIYNTKFGDNFKVTITKDKVTVDDYYCGY